MTNPRIRRARWLVIAVFALIAAVTLAVSRMGGTYDPITGPMEQSLSPEALTLVKEAYRDLGSGLITDHHVHMIGLEDQINPDLMSWWHPYERIKTTVMMSATGVVDISNADQQYIDRLLTVTDHIGRQGRFLLFAFDYFHHPDGRVDKKRSAFFVSNDRVVEIAASYPDRFDPVVSIHPYRTDAVRALLQWADQGVRFVKWLPNSQGIRVDDPALDDFYKAMIVRDMVLMVHGGKEMAASLANDQDLGNPLYLRRPLDLGLKLVVLHCASLGSYEDLDNPGKRASAFDLFVRLMDEPRYEAQLFGEISGMTQINRIAEPLLTLIEREDLHHRLINGSDYPLPAMNVVIQTWPLVALGMITADERGYLNEIYRYNPLLFDFVLKRTIRHPDTGHRLPGNIFVENSDL